MELDLGGAFIQARQGAWGPLSREALAADIRSRSVSRTLSGLVSSQAGSHLGRQAAKRAVWLESKGSQAGWQRARMRRGGSAWSGSGTAVIIVNRTEIVTFNN